MSKQRWATLAGFNLDVRLGQALVVLTLRPLLARRRRGPAWSGRLLPGSATGLGLIWLLRRL